MCLTVNSVPVSEMAVPGPFIQLITNAPEVFVLAVPSLSWGYSS